MNRIRVALAAALAVSVTSCALLPLVAKGSWMALGVGAVLVTMVVGELLRQLSVPRPLIPLLQLALLVPYLLTMLVPEVSGPLPTPDALRALGDLMESGGDDIQTYSPPVPASDGMAAILVSVIGLVAVLVDTVASTYRQAAPAGLPLLALYSVPAALTEDGLGWKVFTAAALSYVLLLLAEGSGRMRSWGRPLGSPHPAAGSGSALQAVSRLRAGFTIGAVTLILAVLLPAVLPLGGNRLLDQADAAEGPRRITTINPVVNLQSELNQSDDVTLLRYRTTAPDPSSVYLRISALDKFDGGSWSPSERGLVDVPDRLQRPPGLADGVQAQEYTIDIQADKDYRQQALPLPYPLTSVDVRGDWRLEPEGRLLLADKDQTTRGLSWSATALDVRPTSAQLRNAGAPPSTMAPYLQLPPNADRVVGATAKQVAGQGLPIDQARRLEDWFARTGGFRYDTRSVTGNGLSALQNFLNQKVGYCEQYSSAMAVMARSLGIPSRVAVGFVPGTPSGDGSLRIGSHDAHAWPELYFNGVGWLRFEPTPSRGNNPPWTAPDPLDPGPSSQPSSATQPSESAVPSASATCNPKLTDCPEPSSSAAPVAAGGGSGTGLPLRTLLIAAGVVALAALLAVPMLARRRIRRRRLAGPGRSTGGGGSGGGGGGGVLGAWAEVLDSAADLGHPAPAWETPRRTAERLIDLLPDEAAEARAALPRLARSAERLMYAEEAGPRDTGLERDVRLIRAGLAATAGRAVRARALLAPPSVLRRLRLRRAEPEAPGEYSH